MRKDDGLGGTNGGSFADHPKTIGQLRSDRTGHAKDITVREMLIELLRDIDSGECQPDFAVVCMARRVNEGNTELLTTQCVGGKQNPLEVYGLLWRCQLRLVDETRS